MYETSEDPNPDERCRDGMGCETWCPRVIGELLRSESTMFPRDSFKHCTYVALIRIHTGTIVSIEMPFVSRHFRYLIIVKLSPASLS